jgi:predicted DNA-binding protein
MKKNDDDDDDKTKEKKKVLFRLSEQEKKALDELALASGKTQQEFLRDAIFHKTSTIDDQSRIEPKSEELSSSGEEREKEQKERQQLAETFDCLWDYKEARSYQSGNWEFETAICRPKTADNDLTVLEVLKYACLRCKVFLAHKTVAQRAARGKATRIVDLNTEDGDDDDRPGYLARQQKALSGRFRCAAPKCDFQTNDQREATKHQDTGFEHWFPSSSS